MATDYNEIGQNPRINYRKIFTPYSDKTHFVYELIQNADDNKSGRIELQLYENELIVWNDGDEFREEDVRSICSIGFSNKDLTQIGTFGMGFKAVYAYTDSPEVYSGDERFRISISNPTQPEGIDGDIDARVLEQRKEGKRLKKNRTIFRLPFRKELRQGEEIALLKDRFRDLEKRALLFLRNLKTVQWYDENSGQRGSYSCHRCPHDKMQDASEVKLRSSLNGEDQSSETFLVFRKEVQPPQIVIDELLQQSEDEDERQRIQKSATKLQPIEIAFKFQDDKITTINNCVLFSYFPTEKKTHLKFLIQASYKTTLARDNIEKDNQWNEWLIEETANYLPEILEELKEAELLEPAFFNILPLKGEMENEFKPIAEVLQKAIKERALVPTEKEGHYAKAEKVFYPDSKLLRELVKSSGMYPDSSLLHLDIQNNESFGQCFKVIREAGVEIIRVGRFLSWLERQSVKWFEARSNGWLHTLYTYLKGQESELERIKKLPLVRLESGQHVCANDQLVFFPPDTDEEREKIEPFLNELPILQSALIKGEGHNDIKLLEDIGVQELHPENLINESICPLYNRPNKPPVMKNCRHVRYIFESWQKAKEPERSRLERSISNIPILRAYKGIQRESFDFVVPRSAYLPQVYTGDNHLETYFSESAGEIWFVDDKYVTNKSNKQVWLQFLKAIGAMDMPQIFEIEVSGDSEECKKRGIEYEYSTRLFEDGEFRDIWDRPAYHYFDGHIVDRYLVGLSRVLTQISIPNEVGISQALWGLLVKLVNPLPSEEWQRNSFFTGSFQGIYRWFYRTSRSKRFDADFYRQLKSKSWIPDKQGSLHKPSECFAPTAENRKVLGDSVVYLPTDFDISTESARWLAEKLDVCMEADPESVLNHLQKLRNDKEISIKKVEPLYRFLRSETEDTQLHEKFKKESLILTSNPEPRWWRSDEVFWEDESAVFDNDRGYLKAYYTENLKSFFTYHLGVSQNATASDYVDGIQKVKSMKQTVDVKVSERLKTLYECLWQSIQKSDSGFLSRQDAHLRQKFKEEHLIFTPSPEPRWWRVDKVFWENESVVFGDHRGYLKAYYPETLKPFFIDVGISERAAPLDYVSGIKEVTSVGKAESPEIRKRIKRLYNRLWQSLQEDGTWQESEEWEQARGGRCWLGKKGNEWGFFSRHELVWNDHHNYIADIFAREVPFWKFGNLLGLARNLEIGVCSQAEVEFHPKGDQEEDTYWSKKVQNLYPYIYAFLNSPRLCEGKKEGESSDFFDSLSVRLVEELETTYVLKEISLTSPNPRPSFLDVTDRNGTFWLALAADEDDYTLLIGDALQSYFGIKDLGRFTEHLLTKNKDKVLDHWKREGLRTELCESLLKARTKENIEKQSRSVDEKFPDESENKGADVAADESEVEVPIDNEIPETDYGDNDSGTNEMHESETHLSSDEGNGSTAGESEVETPIDNRTPEAGKADSDSPSEKFGTYEDLPSRNKNISASDTKTPTTGKSTAAQAADSRSEHEVSVVNESPEIGNEGANSATKGSGPRTYNSSGTSGTSRSSGHSLSTSGNRGSGGGGHGGSGGGGEGEKHENLKRGLANNPSRFGEGLELVKIEYIFGSGDRVDILLKDSSGKPVTVEVETGFSSGAGRYVGVWQAVKYQHLAAMERGLGCEQVRSILAAPEIPEDVKKKCEELKIEPFEVSD